MKLKRRTLVVATILGAVLAALAGAWMHSIDGPTIVLYTILFPENTEYASGYTDDAYRAVELGMTRAEVRALLGAPFPSSDHPQGRASVDWWSRSPTNSYFLQRAVVFRNDRAVGKASGVWYE